MGSKIIEATYDEITFVSNNNEWQKHIYLTDELEKPADFLDCSFICRNVEKPNGCDLFLMEVKMIYFFLIQTSFDLFLMVVRNRDWHKETFWMSYRA